MYSVRINDKRVDVDSLILIMPTRTHALQAPVCVTSVAAGGFTVLSERPFEQSDIDYHIVPRRGAPRA